MKTVDAGIESGSYFVRRGDGTRLRFFDSGGDKPVLMLANGLGGPISVFRRHIALLKRNFQLISWDYRGTYASTVEGAGTSMGLAAHAEDALAILDAVQADQASYLGWSMGVQVGLEAYRLDTRRFRHLVLISGTFGQPLRGVPIPGAGLVLPPLVEQAARLGRLGPPVLWGASRSKKTLDLLKRLQFVGKTFEEHLFAEMLQQLRTLDFELYFKMLGELGRHDASDTLSDIHIPTLVIVGSRDLLTPPDAAQRLASRIPQSELWIIPGGSHYAAAEHPDLLSRKVEHFLRTSGSLRTDGSLATNGLPHDEGLSQDEQGQR